MTPVQRVITDIIYITDRYEDFHQARLKGTPRPWQQPVVMSVAVADRIEQAREHADRTDMAIGEHAAPLHIDVFDALVDLYKTSVTIARKVAVETGTVAPRKSLEHADPVPHLLHAVDHLQAVGHELLGEVEKDIDRLRGVVDRHLGELTTGQRLLAECPWCRGVTPSTPAGGAFTLRVRTAGDGSILVVCESGSCEPTDADCGRRHRGHPAWDLHTEGDWLADRIEKHKETAA